MGFRYRKSINLGGGFRINLSKSGVGYSWGTKGYRITKTASGKTRRTYSIPGTGISYVDESGPRRNRPSSRSTPPPRHEIPQQDYTPFNTERSIESADISQFKEAEIGTISKAIEKTLRMDRWGTILLWCFFLIAGHPAFILCPILGIILKVRARRGGRVNLEYTFDAEKQDEHNRRIDAWQLLAEGKKEWQILSEQFNSNTKTHAGAGRSLKRTECKITKGRPFYIQTNVDTVQIKLQKETLIILPDKVFIVRKRKVGTIEYSDFRISVSQIRFVEDEPVPKDAQVVGHTWKYVNKNGTPDQRYKGNKQLPVCLYGQVFLRSSAGLNVELQISNVQNTKDFGELIV